MSDYFPQKCVSIVEAKSIRGQEVDVFFSITAQLLPLGGVDLAKQQVGSTSTSPPDSRCAVYAVRKFLSSPDCCPGRSTGRALSFLYAEVRFVNLIVGFTVIFYNLVNLVFTI